MFEQITPINLNTMERRKFLKAGSLAAVAAAVPASSILARQNTTCSTSNYTGIKVSDDLKVKLTFSMDVCVSSLASGFKDATDEQKEFTLKMTRTEQGVDGTKNYNSKYKITSTVVQDGRAVWDVKAKRVEETMAEFQPDELDAKELSFQYDLTTYPATIKLKNKKGDHYQTLETVVLDMDCFLTTACVGALGKPDNCMELQTLRNFRDKVLLNIDEGKELVKEYYNIAPAIVENINNTENSGDVYLGIYNNMITPVINSIGNSDYAEAINIYRNYTLDLKQKYSA